MKEQFERKKWNERVREGKRERIEPLNDDTIIGSANMLKNQIKIASAGYKQQVLSREIFIQFIFKLIYRL